MNQREMGNKKRLKKAIVNPQGDEEAFSASKEVA
jgi:hypothetical protein